MHLILSMGKISKTFALLLTLIIAMSCLILIVKPANAQTIPKPSVPEFSIGIISHPYDIPQTTEVDPYTGKTIITQQGSHVENKSIEVTIKNQDYTYEDNGKIYWLVLNVGIKGHFGSEWSYPFSFDKYITTDTSLKQSSGQYTIAEIPIDNYDSDSQLDIQVQALLVHSAEVMHYRHIQGEGELEWGYELVEWSDWSTVQTIKLADGSVSISTSPTPNPTQSPSPSPTVPELSWLAILPLFAVMLFVAVKIRHQKPQTSSNDLFPSRAIIILGDYFFVLCSHLI
jgi:hypothetical protein